MTPLGEEKLQRLRALVSALPPEQGRQLVDAAAAGDPALGEVLRACLRDPEAEARALFFAPLAPLSGDPVAGPPSRTYFPLAMLDALWAWIADGLDPDAAEQARASLPDADEAALDPARARVSERVLAALSQARDDPAAHKALVRRFGGKDFEPVRAAAVVLRAAGALRAALADLPASVETLSGDMAELVRDRYESASAADPDAGSWFLYFAMARLERPWRILGVFELIAGRSDDLLLSRTDMAGIGDALLDDAEHHLKSFAQPPRSAEEAEAAASALADFAALTVGMTREIGIRKDGAWGKRLYALRSAAASQMEKIHARARAVIERAAPDPRRLAARAGRYEAPGEAEQEEARALARFLWSAKDEAARAAVGGAHAETLKTAVARLDGFGRGVLEQLRAGDPERREELHGHLKRAAELLSLLGDADSAEVFLRRGAAAAAA